MARHRLLSRGRPPRPAPSHGLIRDERGAAIVEFALATVFLLIALLPFADYALYVSARQSIDEAVYRAALHAVTNPDAVDTAALTQYINAGRDGDTGLTVTISCNGGTCTNSDRTLTCLSGSSFAAPSGDACAGGDAPGYFITIAARETFASLIGSASALNEQPVATTITARLQ